MKQGVGSLIVAAATIVLSSCGMDGRESTAKSYITERLAQQGGCTVLDVEKVDGKEFKNRFDGSDMYAMEFTATCQENGSGYLLQQKDGYVHNIILRDQITLGDNEEGKKVIKVEPGTQFKFSSGVIMQKKDNGWNPMRISDDY